MVDKLVWQGTLVSVQPRIRLWRSFDEFQHSYLGYILHVDGDIGDESRRFSVAIGKAAQKKFAFRSGYQVRGECQPVDNPHKETAEFYKASGLRLLSSEARQAESPPPWLGHPPALEEYRARGHRRLDKGTWRRHCGECIWACHMPVEIILDHWNPGKRRYREETFCYGPKSCPCYRAGPTRKVLGRNGMSYEEEDWVDDEMVGHRGPDD